jgi:tRNA (guanine10-N2)-methyltransferase
MNFKGPIKMTDADHTFTIFEDYELNQTSTEPKQIYLGRYLASGARDMVFKYDLKKRRYISTTSMDAELSLVTANMALAGPGKLFYDPFVGTGSFLVACAHFGAVVFGSDIDGRSIRGKDRGVNLLGNFEQYELKSCFGDSWVADLTNAPVRQRTGGWLDGIVCDPPYGVREGLKVLGSKDITKGKQPTVLEDGRLAHL